MLLLNQYQLAHLLMLFKEANGSFGAKPAKIPLPLLANRMKHRSEKQAKKIYKELQNEGLCGIVKRQKKFVVYLTRNGALFCRNFLEND